MGGIGFASGAVVTTATPTIIVPTLAAAIAGATVTISAFYLFILFTMRIVRSVVTVFAFALGMPSMRPGGALAPHLTRWRLREGALDVRHVFGTQRYVRGQVSALMIANATRHSNIVSCVAWRELWMLADSRWVRLARSGEVHGTRSARAPGLEALAIEVASALDAPVRSTVEYSSSAAPHDQRPEPHATSAIDGRDPRT